MKSEVRRWVEQSEQRRRVLIGLAHPLTATHLSRRLSLPRDRCSRILGELRKHGLSRSVNPRAHKSRLYALTKIGTALRRDFGEPAQVRMPRLTCVDWDLVGWVSFRHRAAVLAALGEPAHAAALRRRACFRDETLRMSGSNCRDVLKLFVERGIATRQKDPRDSYPRYSITDAGRELQRLLDAAGPMNASGGG